ncbi:RDD family protein [Streptomyces beihaiensis]|uniref:RDD family protein n=1 Tax=Streptomyces beihaiensis TaxID=2984495 RepID=A0ABT3U4J9_9ACTN|nr:RDD family protein [Streptomyces beihaiensis]MCX3063160.1 RDD family protein [Streptomyces beihaiensis]
MSFGDPNNNPYGAPPQQPGYPQAPQGQQPGQPGYGYPQTGQGVPPQQGYSSPQQPGYSQPGYPGYPQQGGYGMQPPRYANWGQRVLSKLIDIILYMVAYGPLVIIGAKAGVPLLAIVGFLAALALGIYQLIQEGRTGQTIGKKAVGIRTLKDETGQTIGGGMAFVRQLAHFLDGLPLYLGYLWPIWDSKRQTFADKVCGTVVIRNK